MIYIGLVYGNLFPICLFVCLFVFFNRYNQKASRKQIAWRRILPSLNLRHISIFIWLGLSFHSGILFHVVIYTFLQPLFFSVFFGMYLYALLIRQTIARSLGLRNSPYFHYCLSSVQYSEDRFHFRLWNCSSHIWFSYIYSHWFITTRIYYEPTQRTAPSWFISSVGGALH